ncbi:hypothetical protein SS50377_22351 [Spironucleus salmonicida]|uniref:Uncharacterized protein n=1 Tax=Spironucleus salmonicida TaxID=348837 RepID=V6LN70_9EUKA|nr:hypothetical protein SS50377_22351 [Spironucleus salmonicida]|eukprot:EST42154.1 Hypothetical protein SS50377_18461 [Spironucleus salmonicida]
MGCGSGKKGQSEIIQAEPTEAELYPQKFIEDVPLPEQELEDEEEQTELKVTEIYFRRKTEDIAVIALENVKQHLYPLAIMKINLDGSWYSSHILSYSPNSVRILLQRQLTPDVLLIAKINDIVQIEIIRHKNPINLPISGVCVIGHGLALPLLIQIQKIYKLKPDCCDFVMLSHKADDLIFKSSLKEILTPKSVELQVTNACLDNILEYFRKQILKKKHSVVLALGPPWLLYLLKRLSKENQLSHIQFYGLQNLYGSTKMSELSSEWADLRVNNLYNVVKFDRDEDEYEQLVENYILTQWKDSVEQEQQVVDKILQENIEKKDDSIIEQEDSIQFLQLE